MILLEYPEWGCEHEYPDNWVFGGAIGADPRADPRYLPTTYVFMDRKLQAIHTCCSSLCDHEAIQSKKPRIENSFRNAKVYYIKAIRPDGTTELIYADVEGALSGGTN
jgi:hypothetical protein